MSHLSAIGIEMMGDGVPSSSSVGYEQESDLGFQRTSKALAKQCIFLTIVIIDIIPHPQRSQQLYHY